MARIYPFRAWRYNRQKIGDLASVVTQPYDKITPEMQERYYAQSPYNFVRLILRRPSPEEAGDVYVQAREEFSRWRREGILIPDRAPAIYAYVQRYRVPPDGPVKTRRGFLALGHLEDFGRGIVFPHERTLSEPKADRLRLLRATRAHLEPIFMLYDDPTDEVQSVLDRHTTEPPEVSVTDEYGAEHWLWTISAREAIEQIQRLMAPRALVIADGHHRYETALLYRDEQRQATGCADASRPYERMLMAFFNCRDEGLTILPTHRLITRWEPFDRDRFFDFVARHFDITRIPLGSPHDREPLGEISERALAQARARLRELGRERPTFGMMLAGSTDFFLLALRPTPETERALADLSPSERTLDVIVLHRLLIERGLGVSQEMIRERSPLLYLREFERVARAVWTGEAQLGFFLNPTRVDQVYEMALSGRLMPQKSTDFYPKLLSGLVLYPLDDPDPSEI